MISDASVNCTITAMISLMQTSTLPELTRCPSAFPQSSAEQLNDKSAKAKAGALQLLQQLVAVQSDSMQSHVGLLLPALIAILNVSRVQKFIMSCDAEKNVTCCLQCCMYAHRNRQHALMFSAVLCRTRAARRRQ